MDFKRVSTFAKIKSRKVRESLRKLSLEACNFLKEVMDAYMMALHQEPDPAIMFMYL